MESYRKGFGGILCIANAVNFVKHHARGDRSEQGFIKFQDKDSMIKFVAEVKWIGPVKVKCDGKEVELTAKVFRTKEDQDETKEIRKCAYVLRQNMKLEGFDKNILDIGFKNKTVLINNIRVAQFWDKKGNNVKGKVDKNLHTFKINKDIMTEQTLVLGYPVNAEKVMAEFNAAMLQ